jgi:hypothetical protein
MQFGNCSSEYHKSDQTFGRRTVGTVGCVFCVVQNQYTYWLTFENRHASRYATIV